jgi:hypothetical protein
MIGIPPATAASNATDARLRGGKISLPWCATSALFAVTTCLRWQSPQDERRAGSMPPISSTTISCP